jgi:hypothetical protein
MVSSSPKSLSNSQAVKTFWHLVNIQQYSVMNGVTINLKIKQCSVVINFTLVLSHNKNTDPVIKKHGSTF